MSADPKESRLNHVYDGIVEEDNRLPNWWLAILFATIVFGFGYWFVFHTASAMPNPGAAYKLEVIEQIRAHPESAPVNDATLLALAGDAKLVAEGQQAFNSTCVACHMQQGQGLVGPNLTDKFWIHGSSPVAIHTAISNGFPEKGMPPWGKTLGPTKVRAVTAYVLTLKGKNVPGKAPQGDPEQP